MTANKWACQRKRTGSKSTGAVGWRWRGREEEEEDEVDGKGRQQSLFQGGGRA